MIQCRNHVNKLAINTSLSLFLFYTLFPSFSSSLLYKMALDTYNGIKLFYSIVTGVFFREIKVR